MSRKLTDCKWPDCFHCDRPEVMANEIYARIVHPLPRAAEKGDQDVFNTGNISHMHHGDSVDSPVTFISGNRGILPDAEKEVSR